VDLKQQSQYQQVLNQMYSNSKHTKKDTESTVAIDKGHLSSVKRFLREEINKYT
jgi:hypothetical protein